MLRRRAAFLLVVLALRVAVAQQPDPSTWHNAPPPDPQRLSAPAAPAPPPKKPAGRFANTPPISAFSRLGLYAIPPTGPGYYSAIDWITGRFREQAPPFPWGRISLKPYPFYDVDFRYLDDPANDYHLWGDFLKRRRVGDCWLFSSGGEFRDRYLSEIDSRLTPVSNTYGQLRTSPTLRSTIATTSASSRSSSTPSTLATS